MKVLWFTLSCQPMPFIKNIPFIKILPALAGYAFKCNILFITNIPFIKISPPCVGSPCFQVQHSFDQKHSFYQNFTTPLAAHAFKYNIPFIKNIPFIHNLPPPPWQPMLSSTTFLSSKTFPLSKIFPAPWQPMLSMIQVTRGHLRPYLTQVPWAAHAFKYNIPLIKNVPFVQN